MEKRISKVNKGNINFFNQTEDFEKIIKKHIHCFDKMSQIKTGWTNFVFQVFKKDKIYIFRFPRNEFFANALIKECEFCSFVKDKISFQTPNLKLFFEGERPYSFHEAIAGECLSDCYHDLSLNEKFELANDISKLLIEFSQIDFHKYDKMHFQKVSNFLDELSKVSGNGYDLKEHDFLKQMEEKQMTISHGDLNPGNLILNCHKLYAVIDFAFSGISSPIVDISRMTGRTPNEFSEMLISAYEHKTRQKVDMTSLEKLESTWKYVEDKYILYIKQNHPSIVLPDLV